MPSNIVKRTETGGIKLEKKKHQHRFSIGTHMLNQLLPFYFGSFSLGFVELLSNPSTNRLILWPLWLFWNLGHVMDLRSQAFEAYGGWRLLTDNEFGSWASVGWLWILEQSQIQRYQNKRLSISHQSSLLPSGYFHLDFSFTDVKESDQF